jgi:hypothetical protein
MVYIQTMKCVDYSFSHLKDKLNPGLGPCQQNQFIVGNTIMDIFLAAHENYVYEEIFDELADICRLGNESVDDLFRRVMQIYCRFPESDEPSGQEILKLVFIPSFYF